MTKIRTDFCQFRNYSYICITELVINPTGGSTKVAEGGLQLALYFVLVDSCIVYDKNNQFCTFSPNKKIYSFTDSQDKLLNDLYSKHLKLLNFNKEQEAEIIYKTITKKEKERRIEKEKEKISLCEKKLPLLEKALKINDREEVFFSETSKETIINICKDIDTLILNKTYNTNDNIVICGFRMANNLVEPLFHKLNQKYENKIDDMSLYTLIALYLHDRKVPAFNDVKKYIVYDAIYGSGQLFYNMSYN